MHATLPAPSPVAPSASSFSAPPLAATPDWDTWEARRRRTFLFLLFSVIYITIDLVRSWADYALFGEFEAEPTAFDTFFVWCLTPLLVLAAGAIIFFLLTRAAALTHRRFAFFLLLPGLVWIDYYFAFDWPQFWLFVGEHVLFLSLCALLAGPEWKTFGVAYLDGPLRKTAVGKLARLGIRGLGYLGRRVGLVHGATWLDAAPSRAEWETLPARRRRLRLFLACAGLFIAAYHLIGHWAEFHLFRADDWYYFAPIPPSPFELFYRWFLTLLPVVVWGVVIFFALTRAGALTHRRYALLLILAGMTFLEADMRWFNLSRKHVSLTDLKVFFAVDSNDLGLRSSDYAAIWSNLKLNVFAFCLAACLTGPEIGAFIVGVFRGPWGKTYAARVALYVADGIASLSNRLRLDRVVGWLCSKPAFAVLALLVLVDPVIVWALDQKEEDGQESRSVIRELAGLNPLRLHSLDRGWEAIVFPFSERHQDLKAANAALQDVEPADETTGAGGPLFVPKPPPPPPGKSYDVLLIQVESLNARVFWQTDLPFTKEFAKKCLRLKRNFSVANATHYGVLGYLHGRPVTFYDGWRRTEYPCAYLNAFKENGYSTRLLSMRIMDHHYLGMYIPEKDWTRPVYRAGNDWACVYEAHAELERPGPHYLYCFYNRSHYPYWHEDKYAVNLPEVPYEFAYNRSDLVLYQDMIVNRYKNSLLEFDDWLKHLLEKVDLSKTIITITGDHGEELFENGRLGHVSSLNDAQTMTPCLVYVPGITPGDVNFTTSSADMLPSIADALGWRDKPKVMGRSIFEPRSVRYAVVANFEYDKAVRWGVVTDDRKTLLERDKSDDSLSIVNLVDASGRNLAFSDQPEAWLSNFRIVRQLEADLVQERGKQRESEKK
jgi:hypothetical protein